jgi:hypothetical protein
VGQSRAGIDDTILKHGRRLVSGLHFAFESIKLELVFDGCNDDDNM